MDTFASTSGTFSLLNSGILGAWHTVGAKRLAACPEEMTFP